MAQERIQKLMSQAGFGSRRQCETIIAAGRVKVNDQVARLGQRANPKMDVITVDGRELEFAKLIYIKLYKPKGVLSSTVDEMNAGRPTIRDLVDLPGHLYPVGRLDKQSEGLILLTNDGPLTHRLTHPRFGHSKVYDVLVEGRVSHTVLDRWREGVPLDGRLTARSEIEILEIKSNRTRLRIILREGRKRQIRRVAASLGHPVIKLVRLQIGPIRLGNLEPGKWQHLTKNEINTLRSSTSRRAKKQNLR